jgi:hypothetical protein
MPFTDEERNRIMQQSCDALTRLAHIRPDPLATPVEEDQNARYDRESEEFAVRRRAELARRREQERVLIDDDPPNRDAVIAQALSSMSGVLTVLDDALSKLEARVAAVEQRANELERTKDVRELTTEIRKLRAEMIEDIPVLPKFNN